MYIETVIWAAKGVVSDDTSSEPDANFDFAFAAPDHFDDATIAAIEIAKAQSGYAGPVYIQSLKRDGWAWLPSEQNPA